MIWAQIHSDGKLHLALEAGEEMPNGEVIRCGYASAPLCRTTAFKGSYRVRFPYRTFNASFAHACRNCTRIERARWEARDA